MAWVGAGEGEVLGGRRRAERAHGGHGAVRPVAAGHDGRGPEAPGRRPDPQERLRQVVRLAGRLRRPGGARGLHLLREGQDDRVQRRRRHDRRQRHERSVSHGLQHRLLENLNRLAD